MFIKLTNYLSWPKALLLLLIGFSFTAQAQDKKWLNDLTDRPLILVLAQDCSSCAQLTKNTLKTCSAKKGAKSIYILALGEEKKMKAHLFGLKNYEIYYTNGTSIASLGLDGTPSLYNKKNQTWILGASQIMNFLKDDKNELCKS